VINLQCLVVLCVVMLFSVVCMCFRCVVLCSVLFCFSVFPPVQRCPLFRGEISWFPPVQRGKESGVNSAMNSVGFF